MALFGPVLCQPLCPFSVWVDTSDTSKEKETLCWYPYLWPPKRRLAAKMSFSLTCKNQSPCRPSEKIDLNARHTRKVTTKIRMSLINFSECRRNSYTRFLQETFYCQQTNAHKKGHEKRSEKSNESLVPFFDCILACPTKKSEPIFNKQNLASPLQHLETKTQTNIFLSKASLSLFGLLAFLCHRLFATLMALQHTHNKRKTSFTLREVDLLYSGHAWCTWHQCGQMEKAKRSQKGHGDGFFATATAA